MSVEHPIPRFAVKVVLTLVAAVAVVVVVAVEWAALQRAERNEECADLVAGRDDARSMWLWAVERIEDPATAGEVQVELDARLPRLHCVDGRPEPLPAEEG